MPSGGHNCEKQELPVSHLSTVVQPDFGSTKHRQNCNISSSLLVLISLRMTNLRRYLLVLLFLSAFAHKLNVDLIIDLQSNLNKFNTPQHK